MALLKFLYTFNYSSRPPVLIIRKYPYLFKAAKKSVRSCLILTGTKLMPYVKYELILTYNSMTTKVTIPQKWEHINLFTHIRAVHPQIFYHRLLDHK